MKPSSLRKIDFKALADDFRNLNPQDVGAWPLLPRIAVLAGLFVGVLVAGWWFVWNDQLDMLTMRQQEEVKLKDEFALKKKQSIRV